MAEILKLFTLQELADLWRLSPHTVRKLVRDGRLHPVRICRRLLFSADEIDRFLAAAETKPSPVE